MAHKELRIPFSEIKNPQEITDVNHKYFNEADLNMHRNEVDSLEDDHDRQVRILKVRKVKFFGPWSHRG